MNIIRCSIFSFLSSCFLAGLPSLSLAKPPTDIAVGQIDAILNFCKKAAPQLNGEAEKQRHQATHEADSRARTSSAYKAAYAKETEILAKGNQAQQLAACHVGLGPRPGAAASDHHKKH
jgi:hypothetical protein